MPVLLAIVATFVLLCLAILQCMLALGAPYGHFVWGGKHQVLPTSLRVWSAISILLYAAFALVLFSRAGILHLLVGSFANVATWILFGYFVLGIVVNAISRSKHERYTMSALYVILAACTLVIALS